MVASVVRASREDLWCTESKPGASPRGDVTGGPRTEGRLRDIRVKGLLVEGLPLMRVGTEGALYPRGSPC